MTQFLWHRMGAIGLIVLCGYAVGGCGQPGHPPRGLLTLATVKLSDDGDVHQLTFFSKDVTDDEMQQLSEYPALNAITIQECGQISDAGLSAMADLQQLESITLIRVSVSDDGMRRLTRLSSLRDLTLAYTQVTGAGFAHLSDSKLSEIKLSSHSLTKSGLSQLATVKSLQKLTLQCQDPEFARLPSLSSLDSLETIDIRKMRLGDHGLENIRGMSSLKRLFVNAAEVTDQTVATLNTLQSLEELDITNATITNDGLSQLRLPNLRVLSLCGCLNVTDQGLANLAQLSSLQVLILTDAGVRGIDLTGLAKVPTLREVKLSSGQFRGNQHSIRALESLLPNCEVIVLQM